MNFLRLPQLRSSTALPRLPDGSAEVDLGLAPARGDERLERAFERISASELRHGNHIRLLQNGAENYPAWLEAIRSAEHVIHFENFIVADDETGRSFAAALIDRAQAGVRVRVLYDWLGSTGRSFPPFWTKLKAAGVDVRVFNPPRFTAPFWVRRDHRKLITVDGQIGFVSGLCIADHWRGGPEFEAWRDTGIALRGPVVADLDQAFAEVWGQAGEPLPADEIRDPYGIEPAGTVPARVIQGRPGVYRTYRLDQFVAATAERTLWLTDAYFVANTSYVQALTEAARDGVDVRLLVPGTSDVPMLQPIVRAGYRSLIEAGIRVFEWNGSMLHAKTAVADGRWARVGSTNLNPTSWATNWELDVVVEDEGFAREMEAMYLADLANATEIVPGWRKRPAERRRVRQKHPQSRSRTVGRLAGGAIALGNTVGTAIAGSRSLTGTESRSLATVGALLLALAVLVTLFPVVVISPLVITLVWFGIALLMRAYRQRRVLRRSRKARAGERDHSPAPAE
ncbi:MAG TPA: phospholipase D-like domain-containing protein [Microvirga sp.]|jgi:cardiolipin synthase|nr:phospholipase D-like domain-containing protein [Microvirga sp.]